MTQTTTEPIKVEVTNHPQPKNYLYRASYLTVQLTAQAPFAQLAGPDPLRVKIRISPPLANIVLCGSSSQAQDANNAAGPATAKPNGRLLSPGGTEYVTEGNNDVWVTTATSNLPLNVGYEIIRKDPQ